MKKIFICLFIVIMALTGCRKAGAPVHILLGEYEYPPYDATPELLNGNVKKVTQKSYIAISLSGSFKKGRVIRRNERDQRGLINDFEATFDREGKYLTNYLIDENDKPFVKVEFEKNGSLPELSKTWFEDNYVAYQKIKWNSTGKITGYTSYNSRTDSVINSLEITYCPTNDSIVHQWYDNKGKQMIKQVYHYDAKGNFTSRESYNFQGAFRSKITVKLNDHGKVGELNIYDSEMLQVYSRSISYEYDKYGNWTMAIAIDSKGIMVYLERKYIYY